MIKKITLFFLVLTASSSSFANYSGTYTCENNTVEGTINLDDNKPNYFMDIEIKRKDNGMSNEYSGQADKAVLGEKELTVFTVGSHKLWFSSNGSIQYNRTIDCVKN